MHNKVKEWLLIWRRRGRLGGSRRSLNLVERVIEMELVEMEGFELQVHQRFLTNIDLLTLD